LAHSAGSSTGFWGAVAMYGLRLPGIGLLAS
jgi:hypothetical protein